MKSNGMMEISQCHHAVFEPSIGMIHILLLKIVGGNIPSPTQKEKILIQF
jgi:hypothetical protein